MSERDVYIVWRNGEARIVVPIPGADWVMTVAEAVAHAEEILGACREVSRDVASEVARIRLERERAGKSSSGGKETTRCPCVDVRPFRLVREPGGGEGT